MAHFMWRTPIRAGSGGFPMAKHKSDHLRLLETVFWRCCSPPQRSSATSHLASGCNLYFSGAIEVYDVIGRYRGEVRHLEARYRPTIGAPGDGSYYSLRRLYCVREM